MRDDTKQLRPWLESWGAWRRHRLNIGYPKAATSCNPDLHIALPIPEPAFRMPRLMYNPALSASDNARLNLQRRKLAEQRLREFYHVKRTETKPKQRSIIPEYNPHWRMNLIDRTISELPKPLREIITLRYELEIKVKELPIVLGKSLQTCNKRISDAHKTLSELPRKMSNNYAPIRSNQNKSLRD